MDNVIHIDFRPDYLKNVRAVIQQIGPAPARQFLLTEGEHPSFVAVIFRKALSMKKKVLEKVPDVITK